MKLIVFDLDGTLLDTLQDLTDSVNYAMDELNLKRYTAEQVRMMVGNGVVTLMERAVTREYIGLKDVALRLQREYYARNYGAHTVAYDGVTEMLARLKDCGFTVAVHTNKDENVAKKLCGKYFGNLVDYVCGTTNDGVTKPNPIKIKNLISKLNVSTSETVYCGDSDVDLTTAENLGVNCVSAAWGFRGEEFLRGCGAKHIAQTPREVVNIILKLS